MKVDLDINREKYTVDVEPRTTLADCLRHTLHLTGTHVGCEHGVCGTCTVILDGAAVRSCLTLAVQADGAEIETVESLGEPERSVGIQTLHQIFVWEIQNHLIVGVGVNRCHRAAEDLEFVIHNLGDRRGVRRPAVGVPARGIPVDELGNDGAPRLRPPLQVVLGVDTFASSSLMTTDPGLIAATEASGSPPTELLARQPRLLSDSEVA